MTEKLRNQEDQKKEGYGTWFRGPLGEGGVCPPIRVEPPAGPRWVGLLRPGGSCWASWPLLAPIFSRSFFRRFFDRFLVGFSLPKPSPNRAKINQKSMPKCTSMLTPFFDRFLTKFRFQLGPPNSKNTEKSWVFIVFSCITPFEVDGPFGSDVGPILFPFWH